MIYRQPFKITGVANKITEGDPIVSTPAEKKRLLYIKAILNGQADNLLQFYHENTVVAEIYDRLIDVENDTWNTNLAKPGVRENEWEIGFEIPIGEKFQVAIKCGSTNKDVYGYYAYELIT